jgi:hypothetical protein
VQGASSFAGTRNAGKLTAARASGPSHCLASGNVLALWVEGACAAPRGRAPKLVRVCARECATATGDHHAEYDSRVGCLNFSQNVSGAFLELVEVGVIGGYQPDDVEQLLGVQVAGVVFVQREVMPLDDRFTVADTFD